MLSMAVFATVVAGVCAGYLGLNGAGLGLTLTSSLLSIGFFITHVAESISEKK